VRPGARLLFEQVRVNDEVWLPQRVQARAAVRVGLVKTLRREYDITYRDFRKFQTGSEVVYPPPDP
jgi:hypothetical protein